MTAPTPALAAPEPTEDLEAARRDLAELGVCVVRDVLDPDQLAEVRTALYRAAELDRRRGRRRRWEGDPLGADTNQRVWNLPSRDPVFLDLVEHPMALDMVRHVLGWPALLSNISANIAGPGASAMGLHADQGYMPEPWGRVQGINVCWCVDDFTDANGGTRLVPGSHRWNRTPRPDEHGAATVAVTAPAGSMVVMEGRVWHRTGDNTTAGERRAGIFAWYTLPIYLPQENWWLSLDPSVRQFGSDTLLTLFGFKAGGFGRMNGVSPD